MARRIALFSGMLLIFLITYFSIRWISVPNVRSLFVVGSMWMALMTLFEFGLGLLFFKYSWARMLEDYDISRGGLMGSGLLFLVFAPWLATKLRNRKSQNYGSK